MPEELHAAEVGQHEVRPRNGVRWLGLLCDGNAAEREDTDQRDEQDAHGPGLHCFLRELDDETSPVTGDHQGARIRAESGVLGYLPSKDFTA